MPELNDLEQYLAKSQELMTIRGKIDDAVMSCSHYFYIGIEYGRD